MTDVIVIGGGPGGLSAALFTAKNELDTIVFDADDTGLHKAHLFNYLGFRSISGDEFLKLARGQVQDRGADLHVNEAVTEVEETDSDFRVVTENGEYTARYLIFATGQGAPKEGPVQFTDDLEWEMDGETVAVDQSMETSVDGVYATGTMARYANRQAIISAGDGATAAIDILGQEYDDENWHDYDFAGQVPDVGTVGH